MAYRASVQQRVSTVRPCMQGPRERFSVYINLMCRYLYITRALGTRVKISRVYAFMFSLFPLRETQTHPGLCL